MKFLKPFLLVLWIAGIILLLVYYIIPQEELERSDTIEKLEQVNEKLAIENTNLDKEINELKKQADSLTGRIILSTRTIEKLQIELDEKINTIHNMSDMELYGYFARFKTDSTAH